MIFLNEHMQMAAKLLSERERGRLFEALRLYVLEGALPRKTFSMGEAWDKRYYLECRKIK